MRYVLEHIEDLKGHLVFPPAAPFQWKKVATSNDIHTLQGIAGSMDRIIDILTGNEIFRTAPYSL